MIEKILSKKYFFIVLYAVVAIGISVQLLIEQKTINPQSFNNFKIFKNSFGFLTQHQNLYLQHSDFYFDLYKYSPTFAALMFPFYQLPNWLGLSFWSLLNSLVLAFAIYNFPKNDNKKSALILLFVLLELITSIQNAQSNSLLVGLLIWAFIFFEKEKIGWAAICIVLTFFIKIFGVAIAILFLFYPKKWKFIFYSIAYTALLLIFPLIFISAKDLFWQYQNWLELLKNDQQISFGVSIMGLVHSWLNIDLPKTITELIGLTMFSIPFYKTYQQNNLQNRINFFCAIILWMLIFNHRAESPMFIIATAAVGLWYFNNAKNKINLVLLLVVFVFTILISTDLIPIPNKRDWLLGKALKVVPCILVWLKILIDFLFQNRNQSIAKV